MEGLTFEDAAQQHPEQYAALLRRDFEHVLTGARVIANYSIARGKNSTRSLRENRAARSRSSVTPAPSASSRCISWAPRRAGAEARVDLERKLWHYEV